MRKLLLCLVSALLLLVSPSLDAAPADAPAGADHLLHLTGRTRKEVAPKTGVYEVVERPIEWDARQTAVIICDLWDKHWCASATRRVGEMAPRINDFVTAIRDRGGLVVHAPSDTMKTYEGTPGRKLAQDAPLAKASNPFKWNYIDPACEGKLPVDDSDGGCDDEPQCKNYRAWTGEHPAVRIVPGDAISDQGQEIYNLFEQRGIKNILYVGVHTNMCVLGRSFGIRQMSRLGKNVALVRDLTDTMYNSRMAPFVPHARGTDLVIGHVETYWCPTVLSSAVLGDAKPAHVVIVAAEQEYDAKHTLPEFAKELEAKHGFKCTVLTSDSVNDIPGLEALDTADLLVMFMRRRELPDAQLNRFKAYFDAGKPVVALRTSSHAFQNWLEFDQKVLGCHYHNHYGKGAAVHVHPADKADDDPILRGIKPAEWDTDATLYMVTPLADSVHPLLYGKWQDKPEEPVAWTNTYKGGRIFYTSLGAPEDFKSPQFRKLLLNGVLWALDRPVPGPDAGSR
jgi:type 1 glutamine amidotransferase/nicotinamidase-related amidase